MKYSALSIPLIALVVSSCDFPSILSEDSQLTSDSTRFDSIADTLLTVDITGGFPGVLQQLTVDRSGLAIFTDNSRSGARWLVELSPAELQNLVKLMLDNNFFGLQGPYVDPRVADAFFYKVTFIHDNQRQTVLTDHFGDPEPLKRIVDGIVVLQNRIIENGLKLQLDVKVLPDDPGKFNLRLTVTNVARGAITLRFSSSQVFDFYARRRITESAAPTQGPDWSWARDKVFAASLTSVTLQVGESLVYQVTWDGRDNAGNAVSGDVLLGATLNSVPGGSAEEQGIKL